VTFDPRWARGGEPVCDALVEGGAASFHCVLVARHDLIPPEDPEPCVAREVPSSLRAWRAWRERRDHPLIKVSVEVPDGESLVAAVSVVEDASEELARRLTALADRLQDRAGMREAARRAIAARFGGESSPDWDEAADAAVGAVLVFLDGGDR
jgi:hypothetical protein